MVTTTQQTTGTHSTADPGNLRPDRTRWSAVLVVAATTFVVVTAEMAPIGLSTPIAASLRVSSGTIGLMLMITGVLAAASAVSVPALLRGLDRRIALTVSMVLVAGANAVAAAAGSFVLLAVGRVLLGLAMGGVWAMTAGLAPRLSTPDRESRATTVVFAGIAVASVAGVPATAFIAAASGWRAALWAVVAVSALVAVAMPFALPALPPAERSERLRPVVARLVRHRGFVPGLLLTAALVVAQFGAFTYVRPSLEQLTGVGAGGIGVLLVVYGVAGVLGNTAAGLNAARRTRGTILVLAGALTISLGLTAGVATTAALAAVLLVVWGAANGGLSVTTQAWLSRSSGGHAEPAAAIWVAVFNVSIALGSTLGGRVFDAAGARPTLLTAAGVAVLGLLVAAVGRPGQDGR